MSDLNERQRRLKELYPEPKREDFPDERSFRDALSSYRHRIGPLLRQAPSGPTKPAED